MMGAPNVRSKLKNILKAAYDVTFSTSRGGGQVLPLHPVRVPMGVFMTGNNFSSVF